jgi:NAD(P)H-hydrate epimerase
MRILDTAASREVDRLATAEYGLPGLVLMENAALGVVEAVGRFFPRAERVVVLCGPGNNGGDGWAVARHLDLRGFAIRVLQVGGRDPSGDAAVQEAVCRRQGIPTSRILDPQDLPPLDGGWDLSIDALFGIGLSRPLAGVFAAAVEWIGRLPAPCLAVDLPSGLSGDADAPLGPHVRATLTVTFEAPKPAHVLPPACDAVGELVVADLGIPPAIAAGVASGDGHDSWLVTPEFAAAWLPQRPRGAHKGSCGHVLIVAGSVGMGGAAVLAARGAIRGGAGLVTCAVPEPVLATVDAASLESLTLGLPVTADGGLAPDAVDAILEAAASRDVVAIGPGLGAGEGAAEVARRVVARCPRPLVVDASALPALAGNLDAVSGREAETILTPHPGELAALLQAPRDAVTGNRREALWRAVDACAATVLLKGRATLVGAADGTLYVNSTGNPGLATGGTGDVLTGLIAALWAQGADPAAAAALGAFVHGAAADRTVACIGETALAAGDLLDRLPQVLRDLETT